MELSMCHLKWGLSQEPPWELVKMRILRSCPGLPGSETLWVSPEISVLTNPPGDSEVHQAFRTTIQKAKELWQDKKSGARRAVKDAFSCWGRVRPCQNFDACLYLPVFILELSVFFPCSWGKLVDLCYWLFYSVLQFP